MTSQSLHNPKPLICWQCGCPHSSSSEFYYRCNGWTMPTKTNHSPRVLIKWETFVIVASDSVEVKANLMRDSMAAIENNKNVAVLGIQIKTDRLGLERKKKVVFLHRIGGDKRVSFSVNKGHASSRCWNSIDPGSDPVWKAFKEVVGKEKEKKLVTYELPQSFPEPDRR